MTVLGLGAPALCAAEKTTVRQENSPPVAFWGIREGCFFDGMVGQALESRSAVGGLPIRVLHVPRTALAIGCTGKNCVDLLRTESACSGLDLSGGVIGGEATEVGDAGRRFHKLRLWKHTPGSETLVEHEAVCESASDRSVFARCAAQIIADFAAGTVKTPARLSDTADCKAQPAAQVLGSSPPQPAASQPVAVIEPSTVYFAVTYGTQSEQKPAQGVRETLEKRFSAARNLAWLLSKKQKRSEQTLVPAATLAGQYLAGVSPVDKSVLLLLAQVQPGNNVCATYYRRADDGNAQKVGETACDGVEKLKDLKVPAVAPVVAPPPAPVVKATGKRKVPEYCTAPIPQCAEQLSTALQPSLKISVPLPGQKSFLSRGWGAVPIVGTVAGLALTIGLGVKDQTYRISWPANPSWQSPEHLLAPAFYASLGLTVVLGVSSAAVVVDHFLQKNATPSTKDIDICSFLPEVRP